MEYVCHANGREPGTESIYVQVKELRQNEEDGIGCSEMKILGSEGHC